MNDDVERAVREFDEILNIEREKINNKRCD